jgi:hypothetical protein
MENSYAGSIITIITQIFQTPEMCSKVRKRQTADESGCKGEEYEEGRK